MYKLPLKIDIETKEVLKSAIRANSCLAELRATLNQLPNPRIILNAITLIEAKESSEIENIITTFDDLYKELTLKDTMYPSAKEVLNYRKSIIEGCRLVGSSGFISTNIITQIHHMIEPERGSIRKTTGTVIMNSRTKEVVHTPPQTENETRDYLANLEEYINDHTDDIDPLIKMAIIHMQFEMIHPFYDGNGRVGRVLNLMYLFLTKKLEVPVLYLSRYIINNKGLYYELLKKAGENQETAIEFILFILDAVTVTSTETMNFVKEILESFEVTSAMIKLHLPKIYSRELVEAIYYEFYTKNQYFANELSVSRNTATTYLKSLEEVGILKSEKIGKEVIYKNLRLFELTKR
jgi:Fic family protein